MGIDVKITFKTVKEQRKFINSHETILYYQHYMSLHS